MHIAAVNPKPVDLDFAADPPADPARSRTTRRMPGPRGSHTSTRQGDGQIQRYGGMQWKAAQWGLKGGLTELQGALEAVPRRRAVVLLQNPYSDAHNYHIVSTPVELTGYLHRVPPQGTSAGYLLLGELTWELHVVLRRPGEVFCHLRGSDNPRHAEDGKYKHSIRICHENDGRGAGTRTMKR